jgi:hypothetical protein
VLEVSGDLGHPFYYYLRRTGPWLGLAGWLHRGEGRPDELNRRLETPGEQTLVILSIDDYRALGGALPSDKPGAPFATTSHPPLAAPLTLGLPPGAVMSNVVVLFPGPYGICADRVVPTGAIKLQPRPTGLLRDIQR